MAAVNEHWLEDLAQRVVHKVLEAYRTEAAPDAASWLAMAGASPPESEACLLEDDGHLLRGYVDLGVARLGFCPEACRTPPDLAHYIDHTLLRPDATRREIEKLCREAAEYHFASVCVNPQWVRLCADMLRGSGVQVCTVVGFPLGANETEIKALETRRAVQQGATEIDMVIAVGALKSGDEALVYRDIAAVRRESLGVACLKVIIEAALLTEEEKVSACTLAMDAGADYVKTSTGFAKGGATVEDVRLMRRVVGRGLGVKAAGGIRDRAAADAMIAAGANRIGASAGVKILAG